MLTRHLRLTAFALSLFILGVSLTACSATNVLPTQDEGKTAELAENGNVYSLIALTEGTDELRVAAQALRYIAGPDINLQALEMIMVEYDLPSGVTGREAIEQLEKAVPTATVGVNHAHRLQQPQPSQERVSFANKLINWPVGGCVALKKVGIIDGGISQNATVRKESLISDKNFGISTPDGLRHGTEIATVLADPTRTRELKLYSAAVITKDPDGRDAASAANVVRALNWMAEQNVKVVNMSFVGPQNKLLKLAIDRAISKGMILVAAAGNQGKNAGPQYPAAFPGVVAVTGVDANSNIYDKAVHGAYVDIAAPGVDVFVPSAAGGRYVTGTSIAAPFVTSAFAIVPTMSAAALFNAADDLGQEGKDNVFGHGLLQARKTCAIG